MKQNSLTRNIITLFVLAAVLSAALCGCATKYESADTSVAYSSSSNDEMKGAGAYPTVESGYAADSAVMEEAEYATESVVTSGAPKQTSLTEKIIYSAYAYIETTDFDATVDKVYQMVEQFNGFLESSSVSGTNYTTSYYGNQTYRNAYFTIRVPAEYFSAVKGGLDDLGYVTSLDTYTDNITTNYYDTQSRLDAYKAESERLIEMLGKADTVEEMIYIEKRLSEVQYSIDSLTSTLKNWQNSVDYSTIELRVNEVAVIRVTPAVKESYWQKMGKGIKDSLVGIGEFFKDVFMWLVVSLPVLLILAILVLIIVFVVKRIIKKHKKNEVHGNPMQPESYQPPMQENIRK